MRSHRTPGYTEPSWADQSSPAGNITSTTRSGRAAVASSSTTCVITHAQVTATSCIVVTGIENSAVYIRSAEPTAGSFTVRINQSVGFDYDFNYFIVRF